MSTLRGLLSGAAALAVHAGAASAQVVINEVFENPPGSTDTAWEYIELYGVPGTDLTGYAVACLKGGVDEDGDGIPGPIPIDLDVDAGDEYAEIDEAYQLDGIVIPANGFVVIYRGGGVLVNMNNNPAAAQTVKVSTTSRHIPSTDTPGQLANDISSTYVLVRRRPLHSTSGGASVYGAGYAWRKDVAHDVDLDSDIDCGSEDVVVGSNSGFAPTTASLGLEPYQMVDDLGWSNAGGKEYTRSEQNQISDTPDFNPDGVSRVNYFGRNPRVGWRFNGSGELAFSRIADEEFIYGDIVSVAAGPDLLRFGTGIVKGPTDPNGPRYDGTCNPDDPNAGCTPNPAGAYVFQDLSSLDQYRMTPGVSNAHPTVGVQQVTFAAGDFNFDKVANVEDLYEINRRLGASLDDTEPFTTDNNTPKDPSDDCTYNRYTYQGRAFNGLLAMFAMAPTDAGGLNASIVTIADLNAAKTLVRSAEGSDVQIPR